MEKEDLLKLKNLRFVMEIESSLCKRDTSWTAEKKGGHRRGNSCNYITSRQITT